MEARRYEIQHALGGGGFGTVYRARLIGEGGFSKAVALKVLHPNMEGADEIARRLRDEARVLGLIRHRAIVGVDSLIRLNGRWAVVMEFVDGADLKRVLRAGPMPCGPALEVAAEVAGALNAAHTARGPDDAPLRLLHRDIKPANIQLTPAGEVKVLDFGIARAEFTSREAETRSLFFGTIEYMAPERIDQVDETAGDIYAVGAVLYEMIVGEPLGRTSSNEARHRARLSAWLERLAASEAGKCEPLMQLVADTLAFHPEHRPSARDLQRRALEIVRILNNITLTDLAEQRFGQLLSAAEATAPAGELTGSLLSEGRESLPTQDLAAAAEEAATIMAPISAPTGRAPAKLSPPPSLAPPEPARAPSLPAAPVSAPLPPAPPSLPSAPPAAPASRPAPVATSPPRVPEPQPPAAPRTVESGLRRALALTMLLAIGTLGAGGWLLSRELTPPDRGSASPTALATTQTAVPTAQTAVPTAQTAVPTAQTAVPTAPQTNAAAAKADTSPPSTGKATPSSTLPSSPPPTPKSAATSTKSASKSASARIATPASTSSVTLAGDARQVSLKGSGGEIALSTGQATSVPAGRYTILADFGAGPLSLSAITLDADESVRLKCQAAFQNCTELR